MLSAAFFRSSSMAPLWPPPLPLRRSRAAPERLEEEEEEEEEEERSPRHWLRWRPVV